MKKILIIFITLAFAFSCDNAIKPNADPIYSSIKVENGRLSFISTKDYIKTLDLLFKMDEKSFENWDVNSGISSLRKYFKSFYNPADSVLNSFENASPTMQATLNTNCEVLIGDTIVWYNQGIKHFIPNKNEQLLKQIKNFPSQSEFKSDYSILPTGQKENNKSGRTIIGSNNVDATWQNRFTYFKGNLNTNAGERKYVHEIYTTTQGIACRPGSCDTYSEVSLRIKLEYRDSRGRYYPAGETRRITLNLTSYDAQYRSSGSLVAPFYAGNNFVNGVFLTSGDLVWRIANGRGPNYSGYPAQWSIDISGSIYHEITDAAIQFGTNTSAWNNEAYPLW